MDSILEYCKALAIPDYRHVYTKEKNDHLYSVSLAQDLSKTLWVRTHIVFREKRWHLHVDWCKNGVHRLEKFQYRSVGSVLYATKNFWNQYPATIEYKQK